MIKRTFLFFILFIISSCTYTEIAFYKKIDKNDKSISVDPTELGSVYGNINKILRKNDFDVYIKNKSKDEGYAKITSRYELLLDGRALGWCTFGGAMYDYAISVVDLKDSQEVFNLTGKECAKTIEKKFKKTLETSLSFN